MKIAIVFVAVCAVTASAFAQTYVKPHVRKDGTYVEGHVRSAPNNTNLDNYGTKGNFNPYTGQQGTQQPNYFPQPSYQAPSYQQPRQQQCGLNGQGFYVCQ